VRSPVPCTHAPNPSSPDMRSDRRATPTHRPSAAEVMQQWVAAVQPSMADWGLTPMEDMPDGGEGRGGARSQ
jgi:hypothetical protein